MSPQVLPRYRTQSTALTAHSSLPDSLLALIGQGVLLLLPLSPLKVGKEQTLPGRQACRAHPQPFHLRCQQRLPR